MWSDAWILHQIDEGNPHYGLTTVAYMFPCLLMNALLPNVFGGAVLGHNVRTLYCILSVRSKRSNWSRYLLACQNEFEHQWIDKKVSSFKPPHQLQTCTNNLLNMKSIICKTTDSQPNLQVNWWITQETASEDSLWAPSTSAMIHSLDRLSPRA